MGLEEAIDAIEGCKNLDELRQKLHKIVQDLGFSSFAFVEINLERENPLVVATTEKAWDEDYRSNNFVKVDPVLSAALRRNRPFAWHDIILPFRTGKKKSARLKVMEAAYDHGFTDGLVVPCHYVDKIGRMNSASCGFFWKDKGQYFVSQEKKLKLDLHLITMYWSQKVYELNRQGEHQRFPANIDVDVDAVRRSLTDRERDVLTWAARGKTLLETAAILGLSKDTIDNYIRNALEKLQSHSKTQAVAKAIMLGLIDI